MKKIVPLLVCSLAFVACTQRPENKLESLDKKSAREVTLSTEVVGDTVLHLVKQRIWANGELVLAKVDTLKTALQIIDSKTNQEPAAMAKVPIYVTVE